MKALILAADLLAAIALLYFWLGWPERSVASAVVSLLLMLVFLAAGSFFFAYGLGRNGWRDALRRLPRCAAVVAPAGLLLGVIQHYVPQPNIAWGLVALTILTSLPILCAAAGACPLGRGLRSAPLWAAGIAWLAAAIVIPHGLVRWVPEFDSLWLRTLSFAVRAGLAVACVVGATVLLPRFAPAAPSEPAGPLPEVPSGS